MSESFGKHPYSQQAERRRSRIAEDFTSQFGRTLTPDEVEILRREIDGGPKPTILEGLPTNYTEVDPESEQEYLRRTQTGQIPGRSV